MLYCQNIIEQSSKNRASHGKISVTCGCAVLHGCSTTAQHVHMRPQEQLTPSCSCCLPAETSRSFSCHTSALEMCNRTSVAQHETCAWRDLTRHGQAGKGCSVRLGCTVSCKTPHSTEPCWKMPCGCRAGHRQAQALHWWSVRHESSTQPLTAPKPPQQQKQKASIQQVPGNSERASPSQEV